MPTASIRAADAVELLLLAITRIVVRVPVPRDRRVPRIHVLLARQPVEGGPIDRLRIGQSGRIDEGGKRLGCRLRPKQGEALPSS